MILSALSLHVKIRMLLFLKFNVRDGFFYAFKILFVSAPRLEQHVHDLQVSTIGFN